MSQKAIPLSAHAGRRVKQRKIPKDIIQYIARHGVTVRTERIANWVTHVKRGEYNGTPIHVVVSNYKLIRTVFWADEWDCKVQVSVKRHPGRKVC